MNDNADIVPLPERPPVGAIDDRPGPTARNRTEVLKEALLALPQLIVLLYRLLVDPVVPRNRKVVAWIVAAYVVSPIDLIPDFIPIVGQVDDILLIAFALDHLMKGTPEDVVAGHWPGTEDAFDLTAGIVAWAADLVPGPVRRLVGR